MSKKILIVSFSMPPSPDIGVRRWVKFAKHLKQNGNLVKVISAHEYFQETSAWVKDVETLKDDLHFTHSGYPRYLGIRAKSFKEKVFYRFSMHYAKMRSKGNFYDKSNFWGPVLIKAAREVIIKHDIKNVICTIPPFKIASHLLQLKKEFPAIRFIVDYRDPWTNNKTAFGFQNLAAARFETEKRIEKNVLEQYDKIIAVSAEMKEYFKDFISQSELDKKFTAIPNGFDSEDFKDMPNLTRIEKSANAITVTFAGTFYDKSVHVLKTLIETVNSVYERLPLQKKKLKFIFIGSMPQEAKDLIDENEEIFSFLGRKNLAETYSLLANSDYCALFLTDDLNYSLSTKFYEYLALQKPILSFSKERGANAFFIEKNCIGAGIDFSNMHGMITKLVKGETLLDFKPRFDHQAYDVKNLVKQVENLLI